MELVHKLLSFTHFLQLQSLSKEEREMIQVHSEACMAESHVEPKIIDAFLSGDLIDDTQLKKHVYCILLKCKIIGKDGKLQKSVILGKIPNKFDSKNITKVCIRFLNYLLIWLTILLIGAAGMF